MDGEDSEGDPSESAEPQAADADSDMMEGEGEDDPGRPGQLPELFGHNNQANAPYHAFTTEFDETIEAEALCDPDELTRLRRSEAHTSELQSLMRNSYAVLCLETKTYHSI